MTAAVYMAAMGEVGMREVARQCHAKAAYLRGELAKIGFAPLHDGPFFHEFVTACPADRDTLISALAEKGILAGLPVERGHTVVRHGDEQQGRHRRTDRGHRGGAGMKLLFEKSVPGRGMDILPPLDVPDCPAGSGA